MDQRNREVFAEPFLQLRGRRCLSCRIQPRNNDQGAGRMESLFLLEEDLVQDPVEKLSERLDAFACHTLVAVSSEPAFQGVRRGITRQKTSFADDLGIRKELRLRYLRKTGLKKRTQFRFVDAVEKIFQLPGGTSVLLFDQKIFVHFGVLHHHPDDEQHKLNMFLRYSHTAFMPSGIVEQIRLHIETHRFGPARPGLDLVIKVQMQYVAALGIKPVEVFDRGERNIGVRALFEPQGHNGDLKSGHVLSCHQQIEIIIAAQRFVEQQIAFPVAVTDLLSLQYFDQLF